MKKGFTLIELMIVILIVGILAAVAVPLMTSRIEKSKYSEGKAIAGQVATALRAYVAEYNAGTTILSATTGPTLGFGTAELDGKYFKQAGITVGAATVNTDGTLNYTITLAPATGSGLTKGNVVLTCTNNSSTFTSPAGL